MAEPTIQQQRAASVDGGNARPWAWVALGAAIAAGVTMFALPESPVFSIGLALLGLGAAWRARGVPNLRALVVSAAVLALLVLALHLIVGLAWGGTTVGAQP